MKDLKKLEQKRHKVTALHYEIDHGVAEEYCLLIIVTKYGIKQ